jgi:pSer/pThr/pTyr-binding forkhead associated (FHA) protein
VAIIGRDAFADIVLPFAAVSSRHAHLEPLGAGRFRVTDLGSSNGTYVSGQKVKSSDVREGEDLRFGSVAFDWAAHKGVLEAELALPRGMTLGRDGSCDLVVADGRVSGRHLKVVPQANGLLLLDAGSANGLFVNGRPVSKAVVGPGEEVRLGTLRVDVHGLVRAKNAPPPPAYVPPPPPPPPVTVVAPPPRKRKGLWIGLAAAAVLVAGGAVAAFATRQDVVKKCEMGEEDAARENGVFFWQVDAARARVNQHRWCDKHGNEMVTYKVTHKCSVCGKVMGEEHPSAPRREEQRDREVAEPFCSEECRLQKVATDTLSGAANLAGKMIDAWAK